VDETKLPPAAAVKVDFDRDIKPIFEGVCFKCHSAERPKSKFSLASRETALKGGENGIDIISGQSAKSPLIHYVARLVEDMEMPPPVAAIRRPRFRITCFADRPGGVGLGRICRTKNRIFHLTVIQWISERNEAQYREHYRMNEGWSGGITEFH
jgi:hypothetical protein